MSLDCFNPSSCNVIDSDKLERDAGGKPVPTFPHPALTGGSLTCFCLRNEEGKSAGMRSAALDCSLPRMINRAIRILGIDPGLRSMGWGIVEVMGSRLAYVACGAVRSNDKEDLAARLRSLHEGLAQVIADHRPDEAAVEETFVNRDPQSALKLGQARGIALVVPALAGLGVAEYAANLVKKTVVGTGHAEKAQIAMMVQILLPKCQADNARGLAPDAADALAVAITHAQHRSSRMVQRA
jgi:crossover junction endodeoxyribonuclease RuvC